MSNEQAGLFEDTLKIAAYGRWSTQKTRQIATLIESFGADNVIVVSCEKGLGPIASVIKPEHVIKAETLDELRAAYGVVKKAIVDKPQTWVCLDGMTRVMNWIADEALGAADEYAGELASGTPHAGIATRLKPYRRFVTEQGGVDTMRLFGQIGIESKLLLGAWIRLDCNLYATYLEDQTANGRDKGPPFVPDVPGNVGLKLVMSSFDYVIRMAYDQNVLTAQMDPARTAFYLSRTREDRAITGELPREIKNFRLDQFVKTLRGIK